MLLLVLLLCLVGDALVQSPRLLLLMVHLCLLLLPHQGPLQPPRLPPAAPGAETTWSQQTCSSRAQEGYWTSAVLSMTAAHNLHYCIPGRAQQCHTPQTLCPPPAMAGQHLVVQAALKQQQPASQGRHQGGGLACAVATASQRATVLCVVQRQLAPVALQHRRWATAACQESLGGGAVAVGPEAGRPG